MSRMENDIAAVYRRLPVDSLRLETRILSVNRPSLKDEDILEGTLRKIIIDETVQYDALSYAWGSEAERRRFRLNGVDTTITCNLASALRRLASEGKAMAIWVDAVCINQADDGEHGEKVAQVRMMGDIYKHARRTYQWLGEAADDSDLALELIANISERDFEAYDAKNPSLAWKALRPLSQRDYWARSWVVPEAVLSPVPIVKCGATEAHLEQFSTFWALHSTFFWKDPDRYGGIRPFQAVPFRRLFWINLKRWIGSTLFMWLIDYGEFKSKFLRDKIYSLLALLRDSSKERVCVDYTRTADGSTFLKSDEEFVLEIAEQLLAESAHLTGLNAWQPTWNKSFPGMPSWVPNWSEDPLYTALEHGFRAWSGENLTRGPPFKQWELDSEISYPHAKDAWSAPFFRLTRDRRTLAVQAIILDVIDYSNSIPATPLYIGKDDDKVEEVKRTRRMRTLYACKRWQIHVRSQKSNSYAESGGSEQALWRTILANRVMMDKVPPPDELSQSFDAWMEVNTEQEDRELPTERRSFMRKFSNSAVYRCAYRSFVTTEKGHFGLGPLVPRQAQPGDLVVSVRGSNVLFVVRGDPELGLKRCLFLGEAYLHGWMDGEALDGVGEDEVQEIWFV